METKIPDYVLDIISNYKSCIIIVLGPFLCVLPDLTIQFLRKSHFFEPYEIVKRVEKKN